MNDYIDIYTGEMKPEDIRKGVIDVLISNQAFREAEFVLWLDSITGYRQIKLKDESEWIVRKSDEVERYVHIHASRRGPYTIRFKGSTLKTELMTLVVSADLFYNLLFSTVIDFPDIFIVKIHRPFFETHILNPVEKSVFSYLEIFSIDMERIGMPV